MGHNVYESQTMACILGDTLRPGGFDLTEKGIRFCKFSKGDCVLDIGCGRGPTVEYLEKKFSLNSFGIDPSKILLREGKNKNPNLKIKEGKGENIPFDNETMDGAFAECTLSLMEDLDKTIREVHRILRERGYFVITDVYAKNPEHLRLLDEFSFHSCMRGLYDIDNLKNKLESYGFKIILFEDHTELLKELMVKIIFNYGSMNIFWSKATECSIDATKFKEALSKCKVGYFLMIVRKGR